MILALANITGRRRFNPKSSWIGGIYDDDVAKLLKATATTEIADIVCFGDSNQMYNSVGFTVGLDQYLSSIFPMYSTGLASFNNNNQKGYGWNRVFTAVNIGSNSTAPAPFSNVWKTLTYREYGYLASGEQSNVNNLISLSNASFPLINNNLILRLHHGVFASGGGAFYPRIRRLTSPYTTYANKTGSSVAASDGMSYTDLELPAGTRGLDLQYLLCAGAEYITGKFFSTFFHAFKKGATNGYALNTLYSYGGHSLYDMANAIKTTLSISHLTHYFSIIRDKQISLGKTPKIIIRINSGFNDRTETEMSVGSNPALSSTKAGYKDNLQAIISRIEEVWTTNNWDTTELYWILSPSHAISTPDDSQIITYREAAKEIALAKSRTTFIDYSKLYDAQYALDNNWYSASNLPSRVHLSATGYAEISRREMQAVINKALV